MARQLSYAPGVAVRFNLLAQRCHLLMQVLQLAARVMMLTGNRIQLLDLLFNAFEFLLRLGRRFHFHLIAVRYHVPGGVRLVIQQVDHEAHAGGDGGFRTGLPA